mmetsp:Transcript_13014/g.50885  ORF Transcript_13014/g.50885 Transcript_13014/m.50885 type:complete len:501 (+) Transcript_13014:1595-3097(+)
MYTSDAPRRPHSLRGTGHQFRDTNFERAFATLGHRDPRVLHQQVGEVRLLRDTHAHGAAHHALVPQHVLLEPLIRRDDVQQQRTRVRRRRHHRADVADVVLAQQTRVQLAVVHVAVHFRQLVAQRRLAAGHLLERFPSRQPELRAELVERAHAARPRSLHRRHLLGVKPAREVAPRDQPASHAARLKERGGARVPGPVALDHAAGGLHGVEGPHQEVHLDATVHPANVPARRVGDWHHVRRVLPRGEVRHEVLEEHRAVARDVGVPSHLEHRVVVRVFFLRRDAFGQVVVVTGEHGEQRLRRGAAADVPAARGGVREDLTPGFPTPHVVAFPRVGAVEHLQVEVRAHRVVCGEGIAAEAEVGADEFREGEEHARDFVGMRDEGVVARPQVQRTHHVSRGGQVPEVLPRALHAHRVRSAAPAEDGHLRVLTDAVEGSELGVRVDVDVAGEVRQELLRGDGARGVQEEIGRERRAHRGDGGGGGTRELLRRPLGQGGIDRDV